MSMQAVRMPSNGKWLVRIDVPNRISEQLGSFKTRASARQWIRSPKTAEWHNSLMNQANISRLDMGAPAK